MDFLNPWSNFEIAFLFEKILHDNFFVLSGFEQGKSRELFHKKVSGSITYHQPPNKLTKPASKEKLLLRWPYIQNGTTEGWWYSDAPP